MDPLIQSHTVMLESAANKTYYNKIELFHKIWKVPVISEGITRYFILPLKVKLSYIYLYFTVKGNTKYLNFTFKGNIKYLAIWLKTVKT